MNQTTKTLPKGWVETTFGELFDFKGGSQPPKSQFTAEPSPGFVRLLQIRDFSSDQFPVYIKDTERWPKCDVDDVMIARYGASLGRVLTGKSGAYNVALIKMIFDRDQLDRNWVRYFLSSTHFQEPIHRFSRSAQNGFNKKEVAPIPVELPPLNEQCRIVSKIESLQERSTRAREALSEVGPLLEQFRQSVLAAAFSGRLTADWRAANPDVEPASELLARIRTERRQRWEQSELAKYEAKGKQPPKGWKDKYKEPEPVDESELPKLPSGWCWATIDSIANKVSDGVHKKPNYVETGIPFLTVKNLTAGPGISFNETKFITPQDHELFIQRTYPEKGDILVTKDGTLGVIRLIDVDVEFSIFVSLALIKPALDGISPFIAWALKSPQGQAGMKATGSGLQHIHLVDLRATLVPVAPLEEQLEIARQIESAMTTIDPIAHELAITAQAVEKLDKSILAKAFRGELVSQDPNDEPASELLERIRAKREELKAKPKKKKATTRRKVVKKK